LILHSPVLPLLVVSLQNVPQLFLDEIALDRVLPGKNGTLEEGKKKYNEHSFDK
jgi:hypothetical protein